MVPGKGLRGQVEEKFLSAVRKIHRHPARQAGASSSIEEVQGQEGKAETMVPVEVGYEELVYRLRGLSFPVQRKHDVGRGLHEASPVDQKGIIGKAVVDAAAVTQYLDLHDVSPRLYGIPQV